MNKKIQRLGIFSAIFAFLFCFAGGLWILINTGFDPNDPTAAGIGMYFIGKALFVGPMLFFMTLKMSKK
jgi:hypothetical protein